MSKKKSKTIDVLLATISDGTHDARCNTLRSLCPCRNNNREAEVWEEIFTRALEGGMRERNQAIHAIGTLMEKGIRSPGWRDILHQFSDRLDALMNDPRTSRLLLAQMKKHGHAHRGAAIQSYKKRRRRLDMATPAELAEWLNDKAKLTGSSRIDANEQGVKRLWRWQQHRVQFQPNRGTREKELLTMAERFLPSVFAM